MRTLSLSLLALSALAACQHSNAQPAPASQATAAAAEAPLATLTVQEVLSRVQQRSPSFVVFDNNSRERYEQGHVPGARWVRYDQVTATELPSDRAATLVFYCGSEQCRACHTAARQAQALGYSNVFIMPGGIRGWTTAGQPTVAGANPS